MLAGKERAMNPILRSLHERKSVRSFLDMPVEPSVRSAILEAAMAAPTAGNQMLYTILDIKDQTLKNKLAVSCDNQAFIAKAPLVLVFLADCRRWLDMFTEAAITARKPGMGDFLLACEDAMVAAQNAVVAAQSLGLGSCYIGDILERREEHMELLALDRYTVPIAMLVFGYPSEQQLARPKPKRFNQSYIVMTDRYHRLSGQELRAMLAESHPSEDYETFMKAFCDRKYMSDFSVEMSRSATAYAMEFLRDSEAP